MSVVIRLTTTGKTHNISHRIVVAEKWSKRDGKFIENLGFYNPLAPKGENYKINSARYEYWVSKGAKPSPAVIEIITNDGVRPPKPKKQKTKKAEENAASETKPNLPANETSEAASTAPENKTEVTESSEDKNPSNEEKQPETEEPKE